MSRSISNSSMAARRSSATLGVGIMSVRSVSMMNAGGVLTVASSRTRPRRRPRTAYATCGAGASLFASPGRVAQAPLAASGAEQARVHEPEPNGDHGNAGSTSRRPARLALEGCMVRVPPLPQRQVSLTAIGGEVLVDEIERDHALLDHLDDGTRSIPTVAHDEQVALVPGRRTRRPGAPPGAGHWPADRRRGSARGATPLRGPVVPVPRVQRSARHVDRRIGERLPRRTVRWVVARPRVRASWAEVRHPNLGAAVSFHTMLASASDAPYATVTLGRRLVTRHVCRWDRSRRGRATPARARCARRAR
jgi:hypothetical protein